MDVQNLFGGRNDSTMVEHLVSVKNSALVTVKKLCLILGALGFALAVTAISIMLWRPLMSLLPFLFLAGGALVWYLWRFVSVEYEYTVFSDTMDVDVIYGQKQRKALCSVDLKKVAKIAPYDEAHRGLTQTPDIKKSVFAASDLASENTYFMIYQDEQHQKTVLYIDAPEKVLKALRRANPSAMEKR